MKIFDFMNVYILPIVILYISIVLFFGPVINGYEKAISIALLFALYIRSEYIEPKYKIANRIEDLPEWVKKENGSVVYSTKAINYQYIEMRKRLEEIVTLFESQADGKFANSEYVKRLRSLVEYTKTGDYSSDSNDKSWDTKKESEKME